MRRSEDAILQLPLFQPNIQFAFLQALMGLQREKERVKDFPNRLVARKQRRFKHSQFSSSLFVPPLLWPPLEKYRFPDWREDLVESCFARLTHFLGNMQIDCQALRAS